VLWKAIVSDLPGALAIKLIHNVQLAWAKPFFGRHIRTLITQQSNEAFSASAIEYLKGTGSPIGFFYFDFRRAAEQDDSRLLGSLILQLAQCSDNAAPPPSLRELYQGLHREPTSPELERVLQNICDSLAHPYIILDAYDECGNDTQYSVLRLIMHLTVQHGARGLIFTRPGLQLGLRRVLREGYPRVPSPKNGTGETSASMGSSNKADRYGSTGRGF
jgi:hypothetical protein